MKSLLQLEVPIPRPKPAPNISGHGRPKNKYEADPTHVEQIKSRQLCPWRCRYLYVANFQKTEIPVLIRTSEMQRSTFKPIISSLFDFAAILPISAQQAITETPSQFEFDETINTWIMK